jgi:hypothetical protein
LWQQAGAEHGVVEGIACYTVGRKRLIHCLIQKPADAVWFVEGGGELTSSTSMAAS